MMRRTLVLCFALGTLAASSCRHSGKEETRGVADAWIIDALPGASATPTSATSASANANANAGTSASAPPSQRVVLPADEPLNSLGEGSESADASVGADASGATDASRATSNAADARAAVKSPYEDAGLFGTKTYGEENPMRGIRRVTSQAAKVHKAPKDGVAITSLPKGTEVSLVAELWDWYRVRYTDPATNVRRQGWVYFVNFAGPRQKSCPDGWVWHAQDGGFCDRECTRNVDCRALKGYKCSGTMCFYAAD